VNEHCIEWRGRRRRGGYGMAGSQRAHRWAYEKFFGPIPDGLIVMHTCDNPPCVNPLHLKVGTQGENIRDARDKGRLFYQSTRGRLRMPAHRAAISAWQRGRPKSPGHRAKIAAALTGRTRSLKHCANLSRARREGIALRKGMIK
jgi:hypothetical protein